MRVSSSTLPSLIGTLKSTRIKTRLPFRSRSLIESFSIGDRTRSFRVQGLCPKSRWEARCDKETVTLQNLSGWEGWLAPALCILLKETRTRAGQATLPNLRGRRTRTHFQPTSCAKLLCYFDFKLASLSRNCGKS